MHAQSSPIIQSRYANIAMFINYQHNQFEMNDDNELKFA
jgi:hypothetical protein